MNATKPGNSIENQVDEWRNYLRRHQTLVATDIDELEDHLRQQMATLEQGGLNPEESFLVGVKRLGDIDSLSREFAREHSERLWKQLVLSATDSRGTNGLAFVLLLSLLAGLLVKLPSLLGFYDPPTLESFYIRNVSGLVFPFLGVFFAWKRKANWVSLGRSGALLAIGLFFANFYPLVLQGSTEILVGLHLPLALWLIVGTVYADNRWREVGGRMDFIRFSGEWAIYFVLLVLGGGVLIGFSAVLFGLLGIDVEHFFESWILPLGAAGGLVFAGWLVEAKQRVIENLAPVLARVFTPLFGGAIIIFLGFFLLSSDGFQPNRDLLLAFDGLLLVVLGLFVYSISAREPGESPGVSDTAQMIVVMSALIADGIALFAIGSRIADYGLTPNRVAALGVNLILLANLLGSGVLYGQFLHTGSGFRRIEKWQTDFLSVYAAWAIVVVAVFPPVFGFV
ncbi:MAG: DUF4153 domain-containing protein [Spirochaetales bacterium]|nr:DUF4153 domain-containing protein [Spirochaetales bacterium]